MRVVSMVPSWTETLISAGINVVGRTRFCIHPAEIVRSIPVVGGTKDINEAKLAELRPELLLLDKEENPRAMAELGWPFHATHICGVDDVAPALEELSRILANAELGRLAGRWRHVGAAAPVARDFASLPVMEWLKTPRDHVQNIYYVIWRDPWMAVSADTFIGSVFKKIGISLPALTGKYAKLSWDELNRPENILLFASEPYPFAKKRNAIPPLQCAGAALLEGENFSWFGVRSLRFLEKELGVRS